LATIYLPQFLLLKWVVVKYSGVPLPAVYIPYFSVLNYSLPIFFTKKFPAGPGEATENHFTFTGNCSSPVETAEKGLWKRSFVNASAFLHEGETTLRAGSFF
jgi:hypothetical protein